MRTATAACIALLAAVLARDAAAIVRCESADGKVTYSNSECPPETKLVRQIDQTPPVVVHDGSRPAPANGRKQAPSRIEPARNRRSEDPVQQDREISAQFAEQQRLCDARVRQLHQLQHDLDTATDESRASAELALRRAQDTYRAQCPKQR